MRRADNADQNTHFTVTHTTLKDEKGGTRIKTTSVHAPGRTWFSSDLTEANRKVQKDLIALQAEDKLGGDTPEWIKDNALAFEKGRKG